jgi:hypothetical protein
VKVRIGILHVDAGNAADLYDFFKNRSGGIEAHGHIRKDGHLYQYRDLAFQADANHDANDFASSWETQGFGEGKWTKEQLDTIKKLMLWHRSELGIPLRQVTSWNDSKGGWGYHTMFGAPSHWTPVSKSCPGPERKEQFHDILVPWMKTVDKPASGGAVKKGNLQKFKEAVLKAAKDYPVPATREVGHRHQTEIVKIAREEPKK